MDFGKHSKGLVGIRIIGVSKLIYGLILAAAGFGIYHILYNDIGYDLERVISLLHLDPENRISKKLLRPAG